MVIKYQKTLNVKDYRNYWAKMTSKEFSQLIENISSKISKIQQNFDDYQKEFFPERSPQFFCLELNGEAGELANLEKKKWKGREVSDDKIADEAADVFIAIMNYANSRGINLERAILNKLKIIETIRQERADQGLKY